ncbi:hypothetical protein ONZ45_g18916 [Pleurotus djamor]|nr:hypothetical protein ONZ45_g18916 [Pleurotus djamor]
MPKSKSKSNGDDDKVPGATAQEMLNAIRRIENAPLRTRDNKLHSFPVLPPKWEGRQETKISIVFIDHIRGGGRRGESSRFRGLSLEQCASGDGLAAPDEHVVLNARELNVVAMVSADIPSAIDLYVTHIVR